VSHRRSAAVSLLLAALLVGRARAAPSDATLVGVGVGLALPTYALGVLVHEGSHALAAKAMGGTVLSLSVLPGRDPSTGAFHFGLTRVRGLRCDRQRAFFLVAPKLTDVALLGAFTGLVLSDAWPENRYAQVTLAVLATGFWVDFSKDVVSFSPFNDVVKLMTLGGLRSELQRLPVRLGYAAVAVAFGVAVAHGYRRTFADAGEGAGAARARPLTLPVWRTSF
jgi:Peptidase M50B-like